MRTGVTALFVALGLVAALALAAPLAARAQVPSATMSMTADRTEVAVGQTFRLQIRADVTNGSADALQIPDLSAFRIVGQRTSSPMQFRFGFGTQQQIVQASVVHDYTLMPLSEGRFEIPPAKLQLGGRTFSSNAITVVATPGHAPPDQGLGVPQNPGAPPTGPLDGAVYDPQAFIRTVVSERTPWLGEQVTVTVYLYTRDPLRSQPVIHREPTADGFWVHDLLSPTRTMEPQTQVVNGVGFQVYLLRRFAAFPLRDEDLAIGAMSASWDTGSIFNLFGQGNQQSVRREGIVVPIEAKPLPAAGRPSGAVAVGRYDLDARLDRSQVATGDAVTLTATVSGIGNVRDVSIELPPVDGVRALAPQIRDEVTSPGDLVRGTRTFEWLLVPERAGTFSVGALSLNTFDPETDAYTVARAQPLTLVAAGNAVAPLDVDPTEEPGDAEGVTEAAPEFGPVRRDSELRRASEPASRSVLYPWALGVPPAVWLVVLLVGFVRERARRRGELTAPKRAVRSAKRRLAKAETLASDGDATSFYGEIRRVLKEVLEVRLGEPVGGYTHPELRRHLAVRGMDEDLCRRVVDELEGSEFARFSAAGASPEEIGKCTERVGALLTRLDRFSPTVEKEA